MSFRYVSNPVVVEAIQVSSLDGDATVAIPQWYITAIRNGIIYEAAGVELCQTKQGPVQINPTDYLIKLDDGEIYPCSEEVFKKKYSKADENTKEQQIEYHRNEIARLCAELGII